MELRIECRASRYNIYEHCVTGVIAVVKLMQIADYTRQTGPVCAGGMGEGWRRHAIRYDLCDVR